MMSAQEKMKVTFTATDQFGAYCPFTEVNVTNVTRGWTETLIYPDTVLTLTVSGFGVEEHTSTLYHLGTACPNPFTGETCVPLEISESAEVQLKVVRVDGSEVISHLMHLDTGTHNVIVHLSDPGLSFLVVTTPWGRSVTKLLNQGKGSDNTLKVLQVSGTTSKGKEPLRFDATGTFTRGDMMTYVGKTVIGSETLYSTVVSQAQTTDETVVLRFTLNVPIELELCTNWGMSRNEVLSFGNEYEVIDNEEDIVAFTATPQSRDALMMYLFDSDSLYCTTILVSSEAGDYYQLASDLLEGYYFMEIQNEFNVYMDEDQTTIAVSKIDNVELAISWVALPQLVFDTIIGYTGVIAGHEYVDLGLSVKWATCNIGADVPEEIGYYFQNGETHPEINGPFQWYTYDYWTDLNGNGFVEPDTEIDFLIPDISGSGYDAARVMWTETWRMPTQNEIQELINNCQIESVVEGGKNCFRITGPNGQSILLPASGYKDKQNTYGTSNAYIWSSTRGPWEDEAYGGIIKNNGSTIDHYLKSRGLTIRPVTSGQSSSVSLNDFLGEYSVTAYNRDTQQYETWTGTSIATFTNTNTNTTWVEIEGLLSGSGYEYFTALGEYSEEHHCIRLYSGWYFVDYQFYFIDDPNVLYYAAFYPIYQATGSNWYYVENGAGYDGSGEAWLSMDSDGTLSLGPSDYPDENGRFANGFVFDYYHVEDNSYAGRFYRYTDVKLTKTSKKTMYNNEPYMKVENVKHDDSFWKYLFESTTCKIANPLNTSKNH